MKTYDEALTEFMAADVANDENDWLAKYNAVADEIQAHPKTLSHLARLAGRRGLLNPESTDAEIVLVTTVLLQATICAVVIGMEMEKHD